ARPSSVSLSACMLSKAATSASTACASSARAPLRKTSVSGSAKVPGWVSWKTLVSVTAYHSFGGEVGGFEHPHDTPPSYPFMPSPTFADSSVKRAEVASAASWQLVLYLLAAGPERPRRAVAAPSLLFAMYYSGGLSKK